MKTLLLLTLLPSLARAQGAPAAAAAVSAPAPPVASAPAAPAAEGAESADTMMLRLRSGAFLWGSVEDHQPDHVSFRRLDTGGLVDLPWSFLDPSEEQKLRLRFGYVESLAEEVMVPADRIQLTNGQELIGRIVRRDDDFLYVKRAESTVPVAKRLVAGATSTRAPALDIFTKDELYQQRFLELQGQLVQTGETGARANVELAQYAEKLFDYAHALHHYQEAQSCAPDYRADYVTASIERTQAKAALQEQIDFLAQIDLERARKQYAKALAGLKQFPELYPESPLLDDWNKLRDRVQRYQERDLRDLAVQRWYYWTVEIARDAARKVDSFQGVLSYLEDGFSKDLLEHVRADVDGIAPGITVEDVQRIWKERKGGPYRQATYSVGTWLLGEKKAKAGLEPEKKDEDAGAEPAPGSAAAERKKLEDRLKRYFQNQELARQKSDGGGDDGLEDPEAFWKGWRTANKAQWVLAYYVEFSGQFEVANVLFSNCRECGGTGARAVLFTGGAISGSTAGERLVVCPTCHGFQVVRRLRYR